jgi:hypothetical protein
MKINLAYTDIYGNAMIVFNQSCYWEIPCGNPRRLSDLANLIAGSNIDNIFFGKGEISFCDEETGQSVSVQLEAQQ